MLNRDVRSSGLRRQKCQPGRSSGASAHRSHKAEREALTAMLSGGRQVARSHRRGA
jgi:hypothetical protein